jgi:hypothetical protein
LPEKNVSSCECFNYPNDPSMSYVGEFCLPQKNDLTTSSSSTWVPIVIGVLSGIGGVFCMITCCLLLMNYSRHRSQKRNISPQWVLLVPSIYSVDIIRNRIQPHPISQAQNLTSVTNENAETYVNNPIPTITRSNSRDKLSDTTSVTSVYDPIGELDVIIDDGDTTEIYNDPYEKTRIWNYRE